MIHKLKTWPKFFGPIQSGIKPFEMRQEDDKKFNIGDILHLEEFDPCKICEGDGRDTRDALQTGRCICMDSSNPRGSYTGQLLVRRVDYVMRGPLFGLREGWVIMAITPV